MGQSTIDAKNFYSKDNELKYSNCARQRMNQSYYRCNSTHNVAIFWIQYFLENNDLVSSVKEVDLMKSSILKLWYTAESVCFGDVLWALKKFQLPIQNNQQHSPCIVH
jgi:hypothetical protein